MHFVLILLLIIFSNNFILFAQPAQIKVYSVDSSHRSQGGVRIPKSTTAGECFIIDKIIIEGNLRTKESIIRRELEIKENDCIPALKADSLLKWERNKIFNLNLFVTTDMYISRNDSTGLSTLYIQVREQFYTIPQPIFDISDRNYNEWIFVHGADLRRVNIGIKLTQRNVFGLNQTMRITVQGGFTNLYDISYDIPYLNKKQRLGMSTFFNYSNNRSVGFATQIDSIRFFPKVNRISLFNPIIRNFFKLGFVFYYRKFFFTRHSLETSFNFNFVDDTIAKLNPQYFLDGRTRQQYVSLKYTLDDDRRDIKQFAHKGRLYRFEIEQLGITPWESQNTTRMFFTHARFIELGKRFLYAFRAKLKVSFPIVQPYLDSRALGFSEDFVRGYDRHPIEGQHYVLYRNSFRFKTFSTLIDLKKLVPIKQFRVIPLDIYLTTFADAGYVSNQNSYSINDLQNFRYSNKLLGCVGFGVNMVTFYNSVLRLELAYTLNGELVPSFFMATDI